MRLWHTSIIDVLPLAQTKGQWSELNSIFSKQNRHGLINFIYHYGMVDLYIYTHRILNRAKVLKINIKKFDHFDKYFKEFLESENIKDLDLTQKVFCNKMDNRYLKQCLFNLQEKFDCEMIKQKEWELIYEEFKDVLE